MEAAVTDLDPPVGDILAEAERRGRRLRRRRRVVLAVASAGAVLLTAAGVEAGLRLASSAQVGVAGYPESSTARVGPNPSGGPPGGSTTEARSAWESASASASGSGSGAAAWSASGASGAKSLVPITPAAELAILRKLLASWVFTDPSGPGATQADLWVDGNDGKGEFTVFVGVASTAKSGMDPADCSLVGLPVIDVNDPAGVTGQGCSQVETKTGDMIMEEVVGGVHAGGYYQYRVIAYRADGVAVEITASDGVASTGVVTRSAPPLTPEQWATIVTDPAWQLEIPAGEAH
jgi:hypothetical protein